MNTKNIIATIDQYNAVSRAIISTNLNRLLESYKAAEIADKVGVATQTVYGWRKRNYGNKPTFETAMRLCEVLNIELDELIKDVDVSDIVDDRPVCETPGCTNKAGATKTLCQTCYRSNLRAEQKAKKND